MWELPDTVSRTAGDFVDGDIHRSSTKRDAIVTSGNDRSRYFDIVRAADMYAISVWTGFWSCYVQFSQPNILTVCDEHVKPFAVDGTNAFHKPMCDATEF